MKFLIIEDEPLIQQTLKKVLEKKGHEVVSTASGLDAIGLIRTNNFDKIICDLMLQDISGFDIIDESKTKYNLDEISQLFIIITAYSSPQIMKKANDYQCKILQKPFSNLNNAINIFIGPN